MFRQEADMNIDLKTLRNEVPELRWTQASFISLMLAQSPSPSIEQFWFASNK
jgi:hypothetical protein